MPWALLPKTLNGNWNKLSFNLLNSIERGFMDLLIFIFLATILFKILLLAIVLVFFFFIFKLIFKFIRDL